ncbi:MAG: DUF695 domain-containing protein [Chitinophagaceae bacterium]|nr:DUF695 domain-containing protein [Chitinophagaceae bacterium]
MKWLFAFFLAGVLSCHATAQGAKEEWDTYMASYDKGAGSVLVNMALKEKAPVISYNYLVITGVKINECNKEGFPTAQEFQKLYKISDGANELIEKKKRRIHAGTFTYNCERTDYYYVNDTLLLRKYLTEYYKTNFPQYSYIISIKEDKSWGQYLKFLYPGEEQMESMKNQKVILKLTQAGDKLEKERRIDHWLYFKTEDDRRNFFLRVYDQKFLVEKLDVLQDSSSHPFVLQMYRPDKPDLKTMNRLTLYLAKEAARYNGLYDGWETFVLKD